MIMGFPTFFYDVKRMWFTITSKVFSETGFLRLGRNIITGLHGLLLFHRFFQNFVPTVGFIHVDIECTRFPFVLFHHLLQDWNVPVIDFGGLSVVPEGYFQVVTSAVNVLYEIRFVMNVIMWIRG